MHSVRNRLVMAALVTALLAVGLGGCGDEISSSSHTADSTGSGDTSSDLDDHCEELLPARTVGATTGEALILQSASAEDFGGEDIPFDFACAYVPPDVTHSDFVANQVAPVALYFAEDPDPNGVNSYDEVVEVGGLPAGKITNSSNEVFLFLVGSELGVQVEVRGLEGADALATQLGDQVAPQLGS